MNNKVANTSIENRALLDNLNHNDPNIRRETALIIKKNKIEEALIPLLNTYFKGSFYLIPEIIEKIGTKIIQLLTEIANNKNEELRIRQYAIEGLGKIGNKSILKSLYQLLKDDRIDIRISAILALSYIGDKSSITVLLKLLNSEDAWIRNTAIWALGIIGDNRCIEKLIDILSEKNLNYIIRKNTVISLGKIGDKRAVKILIKELKNQHSGLEEYTSIALGRIGDKRALKPLIEKYLNPIWCSKQHYEKTLDKISFNWRALLKDYDYSIYRKEDLPLKFFDIKNHGEWHYGYLNKSHYLLNGFNKIIGCLNLIFLSIYNDTHLFYWDTIEIKENYRRRGLGTKLTEFMIKNELEKCKKYNVFLLVANCEQYKLKFFTSIGFIPVKLRKTKVGTHCIMGYPYNKDSIKNCHRMFEYFNWREKKRDFISSDCKYAFNPNPTGLYWCAKKRIYVSGLEKQNCRFYVKEKELYFEEKFINPKEIIN